MTNFYFYFTLSPPYSLLPQWDSLSYDDNGNILTLTRKKEDGANIDQLNYTYISGTNKIQSVTDAITTTTEDWDAEDTQFSYDANGNVVGVLENGQPAISSIQYDYRNLTVHLCLFSFFNLSSLFLYSFSTYPLKYPRASAV